METEANLAKKAKRSQVKTRFTSSPETWNDGVVLVISLLRKIRAEYEPNPQKRGSGQFSLNSKHWIDPKKAFPS